MIRRRRNMKPSPIGFLMKTSTCSTLPYLLISGLEVAPIYVSNDGYVLDGHHRWAAIVAHNAANPDKQIPMNVRVIDEPIVPLVKRSNKFAEDIGIKAKAADTGAAGGSAPL